jgi:hypothetical protein
MWYSITAKPAEGCRKGSRPATGPRRRRKGRSESHDRKGVVAGCLLVADAVAPLAVFVEVRPSSPWPNPETIASSNIGGRYAAGILELPAGTVPTGRQAARCRWLRLFVRAVCLRRCAPPVRTGTTGCATVHFVFAVRSRSLSLIRTVIVTGHRQGRTSRSGRIPAAR